ncbi:Pantoate kinase [uncultured archaeon]|nr:Pantoate kinase [uncultured archaeon]
MPDKASAQSPGHITGFFVIYPNGSTGAGLNIEGGMKTTVEITGNGRPRNLPDAFFMNGKKEKKGRLIVSEKVLELFRKKTGKEEKVTVRHRTKFPIGYGLGISGAGALSLTIALNNSFSAGLTKAQVLEIAKKAEIKCGTGLGDVVAEQFAGLIMGRKPYPSKGIERIKCREKYIVLGFFRPISTKKIIRSRKWKLKINKVGLECMREIEKEKTMGKFTELSREFTLQSGLGTPEILRAMEKIPGASMSMLGETIFLPTSKPEKMKMALKKICKRAMIAKIAAKGAGLP